MAAELYLKALKTGVTRWLIRKNEVREMPALSAGPIGMYSWEAVLQDDESIIVYPVFRFQAVDGIHDSPGQPFTAAVDWDLPGETAGQITDLEAIYTDVLNPKYYSFA